MKIGDEVRFLNETGGGMITGFEENGLVKVLTEDGFEFPVMQKELIVVSTTAEDFDKNATVEGSQDQDTSDNMVVEEENREEPGKTTVADFLKPEIGEGKEKVSKPGTAWKIEEVDLHIQQIIPEYDTMTSGEILEAQLARFTTSLDGAIRRNQKKIVYIHGKGAGKLKYEMQKILKEDYPRLKFQDASFKEYGYGAMMIII